ncbi:TPA: hypothetical protein VDV44_001499 [Pseudomonas aeruginosa]|uniref:hypothetical protein n=1 Tax=Pseudomonas aeruginosa TaxID=287 RepID=UPI0006662E92|nr:hypothetical protein [Pseudomonas aeruginosa]UDY80236.1 hypothetical protein PAE2_11 [Pseudomonas phage PAE2]KSP22686.1 hypothetical protein APB10_19325 [Pseudomonas aeruginosa]MBX6335249.1 hypothetical protein [Pseudomonas aeruginosa]RQE49362.1 hypothetical protein IPC308_12900 [Pseudomonas aeruginosa]HBO4891279.1 hypothetical protein [Pseudomonas aeruginosa]
MSLTYSEMIRGQLLTATPTSYYSAPTNASASIQAVTANNPTGAAVVVDLYKVPSGSAADGTTKIASRTVPAGTTVTLFDALNHKLQSGTALFAAGNGCGLNVSGVEYIPE